jgi:putative flippase GtrA
MKAGAASTIGSSFLRFLIGGAVNTALTYALFLLLDRFLHHSIAYTIAYLGGILLAYVLAAQFVFRTGFDLRSAVRFPGVYIVQYLYGLAALSLLIDVLRMRSEIAMLLVIATAVPLTFVLSKYAVRSRESVGQHPHE